MISLRPYQTNAIACIKNTFVSQSHQFIEMPTGSGKTVTFLSYAKKNAKSVLIVVPSRQLLNQVYNSALMFYDRRHISRKGNNYDEEICDIHICIINSIKDDYLKYLAKKNFDLVIIDEAHHVQAQSYRNFIDCLQKNRKHNKINFLGVTATPDRRDGLFIREILGNCSFKIEIKKLIEEKYLCDIEGYRVKTGIDISDIQSQNGDFSLSQLYKRLCTKSRNSMILDICKKDLIKRRTLIFCINIKHSQEICLLLKKANLKSAHIDGTMNEDQRKNVLASFKNGEVNFLCNCQLLTEGFDEPMIDGILLARPTTSRALFLQMVGRGLRIFKDKKNCKIIDVADNHKKLSSFSDLLSCEKFIPIESFNSIKDIKEDIEKNLIQISDYELEKSNILNLNPIDTLVPTQSMQNYLIKNKITYPFELTFDECSFVMWLNELKKEYKNGSH